VSKTQQRLLYFLIFAIIFIFGLVANFRVVSFPLIREDFDVTWQQQGFLVSLRIISFVGFCVITGILTGRFGIKRPLLAGFAIICSGLAYMYFVNSFFMAAIAMVAIGSGIGVFEVSCNGLASRLFVKNTALMLNLLYAFFGIGAVFAPLVAGFITNNADLSWRMIYFSAMPLALLLFIVAFFVKFPDSQKTEGGGGQYGEKRKTFIDALKEPFVWLLAVCLGLGISIENNSSNWGTMFFMDIYGIDPRTTGATFMALFFICFTVSRLACGMFIERIGYTKSLIGLGTIVAGVFTAVILLGARGIFLLPALGFFIGPLFPTTMAVAFRRFGKDSPVMCSAAIAAGGTLNAGIQYTVGLTNRFFGAAWGFRSSLIYILLFIAILVIIDKSLKPAGAGVTAKE